MAMIRKTITISQEMERWIKAQIDEGRYAGDSEYFRDLIRRDQDGQRRPATAPAPQPEAAARPAPAQPSEPARPAGHAADEGGEEIWEEVEARLSSLDDELLSKTA